jgi:hypothetical protein
MTALSCKLCLEIKNAGWPQPVNSEFHGGWCLRFEDGRVAEGSYLHVPPAVENSFDGRAYSPSLDELIEACPGTGPGETHSFHPRFVLFHPTDNAWIAGYEAKAGSGIDGDCCGEGTSAKEAVARLWLSLPPELRVRA